MRVMSLDQNWKLHNNAQFGLHFPLQISDNHPAGSSLLPLPLNRTPVSSKLELSAKTNQYDAAAELSPFMSERT